MLFKVVSAAIVAAVAGVYAAEAQSVRSIGGPAETPPSSYKGQSYVDSRGCVFLRAGYGGTVTWVPRVSRDRKPLCGYPRTQSAGAAPAPAAVPALAPAPTVVAAAPAPRAPVAVAPVVAQTRSPKPAPTVVSGPSATAAPQPVQVARAASPLRLGLGGGASPSPAPAPTVVSGPSGAAPAPMATIASIPRTTVVAGDSTGIYAQLQREERAGQPRAIVVPGGGAPMTGGTGYVSAGAVGVAGDSGAIYAQLQREERAGQPRAIVIPGGGGGTVFSGGSGYAVGSHGNSEAIYAQIQAEERAQTPRAIVQPWAQAGGGAVGAGQAMACDPSVPVAQRFRTNDGRSVILCTKGDGSVAGAQAPIIASASGFAAWQLQSQAEGYGGHAAPVYHPQAATRVTPAPSAGGAAVSAAPRLPGVDRAPIATARGYDAWMLGTKGHGTGGGVRYSDPAQIPGAVITVPKGYKPAWRDGRLNPMRGYGTVEGQMSQDMVWTREVPARLVPRAAAPSRVVVVSSKSAAADVAPRSKVTVSSKSAPKAALPLAAAKAAKGSFYVQVGTFGQGPNADGAKARLRSAGLPIGTAKITKGGQAMQIVLAGPFPDKGAAQAGLKAARRAGFGDAFLR